MPVRCMLPSRLRSVGKCLATALRGLRAMVARAAMQHGDRRHSLRGNGKRHKPDQHGPEQLPHLDTLQQLP